ncbi:MAG TPA: sialidase family protein, partial [Candidatus Sulfotelmatobacter sp.]|nr:sialidase family protein [Candidatus Sulfotelmatobacter sp.]
MNLVRCFVLATLSAGCLPPLGAVAAGSNLEPAATRNVSSPPPSVPGVVVDYSPAASGLYIGSPSLVVLTNGDYLAAHDFFGPKSREFEAPVTAVFRSANRGETWQPLARLSGQFWSSLFVHRGAAYLLGTDKHHGRIVIRRSTDGGTTWTTPQDTLTGLLTPTGQYHTAPVPVIEHEGRLWRGFEDAMGGTEWGKRYRAGMLSVSVLTDLLQATNWTFSNFLPRDPQWLGGQFNAWLEGNAVLTPEGRVVDMLRVDLPGLPEKAALVQISADGRAASFDPATGFVAFPGSAKKFTIRPDPRGGGYWSLASIVATLDQTNG